MGDRIYGCFCENDNTHIFMTYLSITVKQLVEKCFVSDNLKEED